MQVADRDRERIGCVGRLGDFIKPEQTRYHLLHLMLFRSPITNHG